MNAPIPKPIKHKKELATARPPQKKSQIVSDALNQKSEPESSEKKAWNRFLSFIADDYKSCTPKYHEENPKLTETIQLGIDLLEENYQESWESILSRVNPIQREDISKFYGHLSAKEKKSPQEVYQEAKSVKGKKSPQEVYQEAKSVISEIINNAEYGFLENANRDVSRISQLCKAIEYFERKQAKTYFIIYQLQKYLPDDVKPEFLNSRGIQKIIEAGYIDKLKHFGRNLMDYFRITRTAIHDETASNLVLEIGETERKLRTEISLLEQEKLDLENQLKQKNITAREEAMTEIAKKLQNGGQPALDQIQQIIDVLKPQVEENGEWNISPEQASEQALSVFIILSNLMKILRDLGIKPYPEFTKSKFSISQAELTKYNYTEGTPFYYEQDLKEVECFQQGWIVGDSIITPAKVRELKAH